MKLIIYLTLLLSWLPGAARTPKRFYVQTVHPEGLLYFVFPRKMPEANGKKTAARKPLQYDYTYLDACDSVTLLATVVTGPVFKADSLCIAFAGGEQKKAAAEPIYCQPVKRGWECRVRCRLHRDDWERLYRAEAPFTLTFFSTQSDLRPCFGDKPRNWPKVCARFVRLQEIIRLNRKN